MDRELEELERLFSDHFGRTPLCTPAGSQEEPQSQSSSDEDTDDVHEHELQSVDAKIQTFLNCMDDDHVVIDFATNDAPDEDLSHIRQFKSRGCGCHRKCDEKFSEDVIYSNILDIREMEKSHRDMRILKFICECTDKETTKRWKKRQRFAYEYSFNGQYVCKYFFTLAFDIGKRSLENLLKHLSVHGAVPRTHGNTGKKPSKALKFEEIKYAVTYITNYADEFGLPQPAAPRGRDDTPPINLPSETTKKSVHEKYLTCSTEAEVRSIGYSTFAKIWSSCLPHIKIANPRDDVCGTCEKIRKEILDSVSEESKLDSTQKMREHIILAQKEREVYNDCIKKAKETVTNEPQHRFVHYTFDYSQNVSIPHHSRQMGPVYFTTPRKVQIFGFRIDGIPRQINFLIDENETMGKDGSMTHGPNAVISMRDWALETYSSGEVSCSFHADNCPGQNKNQFVIGYFMWRVMTGRHQRIEYMMQVPGHARCLVDAGFASLKQKYRRSDCDSIDRLAAIVDSSSKTNEAVRYPAWKWRDWKAFLGPVFRSVRGIREYQFFRFEASNPGVVTVRKGKGEPETSCNILKTVGFVFDNDLPAEIPAHGLSVERQTYLYKVVRPFVRPSCQDFTCPAPTNS